MRQDPSRAERPLAQDAAADELLGRDPLALLVVMLLDQHMRQRSGGASQEATPAPARW